MTRCVDLAISGHLTMLEWTLGPHRSAHNWDCQSVAADVAFLLHLHRNVRGLRSPVACACKVSSPCGALRRPVRFLESWRNDYL